MYGIDYCDGGFGVLGGLGLLPWAATIAVLAWAALKGRVPPAATK